MNYTARISPAMRPWSRLAIEGLPIVVVTLAGLAVVGHLVTTDWIGYLFYNADSLVLALFKESVVRGEPFEWVFSAQMFLFPEGLFYAVSSLFTSAPRVAFAINVVVNVVALYAILRGIVRELAHRGGNYLGEATIALAATLLYCVLVLLEPIASPNRSGIATLFVLSTYNYGVALGGLALVLLVLWATRAFRVSVLSTRTLIAYGTVATALTVLVAFSNLLFLLEALAPMWLTLLVLVFMDRLSWKRFRVLAGFPALGIVLTFIARFFVHGLFGNEVTNYLGLSLIPDSIKNLYLTLVETVGTPQGLVKLVVVLALSLVNAVFFIWALYAQARPALAARITTADIFVSSFVVISAVALLVGQVGTGSTASRYLQPLFGFPMISAVAIGCWLLRRPSTLAARRRGRVTFRRLAIAAITVASLAMVGMGVAAVRPVVDATRAADYTGADCLNDYVGDSDANGVGTFWLARPFQLYGLQKGQVLQVKSDLTIDPWMINLASYDQARFSYVIGDGTGILTADGITGTLGQPRRVIDCGNYQIYDYAGTSGEDVLTERIQESRQALLLEHYPALAG